MIIIYCFGHSINITFPIAYASTSDSTHTDYSPLWNSLAALKASLCAHGSAKCSALYYYKFIVRRSQSSSIGHHQNVLARWSYSVFGSFVRCCAFAKSRWSFGCACLPSDFASIISSSLISKSPVSRSSAVDATSSRSGTSISPSILASWNLNFYSVFLAELSAAAWSHPGAFYIKTDRVAFDHLLRTCLAHFRQDCDKNHFAATEWLCFGCLPETLLFIGHFCQETTLRIIDCYFKTFIILQTRFDWICSYLMGLSADRSFHLFSSLRAYFSYCRVFFALGCSWVVNLGLVLSENGFRHMGCPFSQYASYYPSQAVFQRFPHIDPSMAGSSRRLRQIWHMTHTTMTRFQGTEGSFLQHLWPGCYWS